MPRGKGASKTQKASEILASGNFLVKFYDVTTADAESVGCLRIYKNDSNGSGGEVAGNGDDNPPPADASMQASREDSTAAKHRIKSSDLGKMKLGNLRGVIPFK